MGARFIQVQRNVPGMLGKLNEVLARHAINIAAQYYETRSDIGYVVLDADASAADSQVCSARSGLSKGHYARGSFMSIGFEPAFW
jgi:hypothetical protein